jgi:hypothetical protein
MKFNLKSLMPYGIAVLVFFAITFFFFKPVFNNKVLLQGDIIQHKGMSKEIADFRVTNGNEPLWTNTLFAGMPAYQISTLYPGNWLGKIDAVFKLFIPLPAGYFFLYFIGFFILLLCLDVNPWLSLIGAVAYGLSSYFLIILEAGHNSKANALGYLPALVGGILLLFRGRYWLGFGVTTLFTAMELNCNHVQITYYGYILIGFIVAGYFITSLKEKQLANFFKAVAFVAIASIIGILPNTASLMATNEYGKYTTRGNSELTINSQLQSNAGNKTSGLDRNYATGWSYGIDETFTFLIPNYKGGASSAIGDVAPDALKKVSPDFKQDIGRNAAYYGTQPGTSGPVYIGAIIMFLFLIGMCIVKHPIKWPVFLATLLTIALSWGSNFMGLTNIFMDYLPGYNKFRAVSMILIVAELTIPLMAILAINEFLKVKSWEEVIRMQLVIKGRDLSFSAPLKKLVFIFGSITAGFCLLCYVMPGAFNNFTSEGEANRIIQQAISQGSNEAEVRPVVMQMMDQLSIAREAIFKADALRSFLFIALGFGVLFLFFTHRIKRELFLGAIGLLIAVDLLMVDTRYVNGKSFVSKEQNNQMVAQKTATDEEILKDPDPNYKVLNLASNTFNEASTSYYHKSLGGNHGAKLKKYAEIIEFHLDKEINQFYGGINQVRSDSALNALMGGLNVINMLNTKYIIVPADNESRSTPIKNPQANGNAWFVKQLKTVANADSEIVSLYKLDVKNQAVIREAQKKELNIKDGYSGTGQIKLTSYKANELIYSSESDAEGFAVFSEIYYPKGWNAYIDDKLVPHASVNYVLRGMPIPAGKHTIRFKFEPQVYKTGNTVARIGSILVFLTVILALFFEFRKQTNVKVS